MNTAQTEREAVAAMLLDLARTCYSVDEALKFTERMRAFARVYDDAANEAAKRADELSTAKNCHPR